MLFAIALPTLLAIAYGYARGGRLRNLTNVELRAWWLLSVAAILQLGRYRHVGLSWLFGSYTGMRPVLIIFGLVAVWLVLNTLTVRPERRGMLLIASGWLANLLVMTLNSGMPVSRSAALSVGFTPHDLATKDIGDYHVLTGADRLGFLGDIIPTPYLHRVASIGDVLIVVGMMVVFAVAMRGGQRVPADAHAAAVAS